MSSFNAVLPRTSLEFGSGAIEKLGEKAAKYGAKALLVSGKGAMKKLGFLDKAKGILEKDGLSVAVFEGVEPNPTVPTVDKGVALGKESKCDVVVALGGGSAMDAAKAIAVGIPHFVEGDTIWNYIATGDRKAKPITEKTLPVVAVTSTSGTGSHVTPYAVITNPKTHEKPGFGSEFIYPRESIYDIDLVKSMPSKVTAETGFDVLAHAMEAHASNQFTPFTSLFSLNAIALVSQNLEKAFFNSEGMSAREGMALADTCAGIAITLSGTIAVHSLSHSLSGNKPEIAHGQALAALSPAIMEFNIAHGSDETRQRYAEIAKALGRKAEPMNAVEAVKELSKKLGLSRSLAELCFNEQDVEKLCSDVFKATKRTLSRNPVEMNRKRVEGIYRQCI